MALTLAHLSDPHLGPMPPPRPWAMLNKRGLGFINWHFRRKHKHSMAVLTRVTADLLAQAPDQIAVTGDVTNLSLPEEIVRAEAWLSTLGAPQDVLLVRGNHDAYIRRAVPQIERDWAAFLAGDTPGTPAVRRRGPVALIGVSSAVPTGPLMATGKVGAAQLAALERALLDAREAGLFRVVMLHHPPGGDMGSPFQRLRDAAGMRAVLERAGAELVLHGHRHRHLFSTLPGADGPIPVIGVPSASEQGDARHDAAGYNLFTIDGQPDGWHCLMVSRALTPDGTALIERERRLL